MSTINKAVRFRPSNREHMKRWIEALESGNYRQTSGTLRAVKREGDDNRIVIPEQYSYCCLGVACEVAKADLPDLRDNIVETYVVPAPYWDDYGRTDHRKIPLKGDYVYSEDGSTAFERASSHLPHVVREWLGIDAENPIVGYGERTSSYTRELVEAVTATDANDDRRWDFAQIAKWLRYIYMIDWTDEQVREAARWEEFHQRYGEAIALRQMIGDQPVAAPPEWNVPAAPEDLPDPTASEEDDDDDY